MFDLIFAGLKGISAYMSLSLFNNRIEEGIIAALLGCALTLLALVVGWAVCQWIMRHRGPVFGVVVLGAGVYWMVNYQGGY